MCTRMGFFQGVGGQEGHRASKLFEEQRSLCKGEEECPNYLTECPPHPWYLVKS